MLFSDSKQNKRRRKADQQRKKKQEEQRRAKSRVRRRTKPVAGLAAGLLGGLIATWVLDNYQRGAAKAASESVDDPAPDSTLHANAAPTTDAVVAEGPAATLPPHAGLPVGSAAPSIPLLPTDPRLRYLTGAVAGAIYGISVELVPMARSGYGTGFASLLFLGGTDVLAPFLPPGVLPESAAKTSKAEKDKLPGGLSAHIIYGATLETVRRVLRWFL